MKTVQRSTNRDAAASDIRAGLVELRGYLWLGKLVVREPHARRENGGGVARKVRNMLNAKFRHPSSLGLSQPLSFCPVLTILAGDTQDFKVLQVSLNGPRFSVRRVQVKYTDVASEHSRRPAWRLRRALVMAVFQDPNGAEPHNTPIFVWSC